MRYVLLLLFFPLFIQAQSEKTRSENVKIVDTAFHMPQLQKNRRIWIYLPPGYDNTKLRYPVIYMQDGQNVFDAKTSAFGEWGVDEILDSLLRKPVRHAIVVGIDHGGDDRLKEYNPYDSKYGKGAGKTYVEFLVKTLKPYIDENFRTLKTAKNTTVAGSSMGGLISLYAAAKYPEVFGNVGIFSPAFWIAPDLYKEIPILLSGKPMPKMYFVAGGLEGGSMLPDMEKMYHLLNPNGKSRRIVMRELPDGKHSEWFWHREFPDFYQFIFK